MNLTISKLTVSLNEFTDAARCYFYQVYDAKDQGRKRLDDAYAKFMKDLSEFDLSVRNYKDVGRPSSKKYVLRKDS